MNRPISPCCCCCILAAAAAALLSAVSQPGVGGGPPGIRPPASLNLPTHPGPPPAAHGGGGANPSHASILQGKQKMFSLSSVYIGSAMSGIKCRRMHWNA